MNLKEFFKPTKLKTGILIVLLIGTISFYYIRPATMMQFASSYESSIEKDIVTTTPKILSMYLVCFLVITATIQYIVSCILAYLFQILKKHWRVWRGRSKVD